MTELDQITGQAARQRMRAEIATQVARDRARITPAYLCTGVRFQHVQPADGWECQACWSETRRPWEAARTIPEDVDPVSTYCERHKEAS